MGREPCATMLPVEAFNFGALPTQGEDCSAEPVVDFTQQVSFIEIQLLYFYCGP